MPINYKTKLASQDTATLYSLIGEALCKIQHLEGALSISITLKSDVKIPGRILQKEADEFRRKNQRRTLGESIKKAKGNSLYSNILYCYLETILNERNWLVHNLLHDNFDDLCLIPTRNRLLQRIKAISNKAKILQGILESDLIEFCESVGKDMSRVRAEIEQN